MRESNCLIFKAGFSLTELLIVIALMGIFSAFAIPSFWEWRENMTSKQVANQISSAMKSAQSKAITFNKQHGVNLDKSDNSYQFSRYSATTKTWVNYGNKEPLSKNVTLKLNSSNDSSLNVGFNYYGSAFGNYSIYVIGPKTAPYKVTIQQSGRIKISK